MSEGSGLRPASAPRTASGIACSLAAASAAVAKRAPSFDVDEVVLDASRSFAWTFEHLGSTRSDTASGSVTRDPAKSFTVDAATCAVR